MTRYGHSIALRVGLFAVWAAFALAAPALAADLKCDEKSFAAAIDETAQILRNLNRDTEQRFQERMRAVAKTKGWSDNDLASKSAEAMDDSRLATFNTDIEQLVSQLDRLSATPKGEVSCERLRELRNVRDRLVTVLGQKSGFVLAQIDYIDKQAPSTPGPKRAEVASIPSTPAPSQKPEPKTDPAPGPAPANKADGGWRPPSWSADVVEKHGGDAVHNKTVSIEVKPAPQGPLSLRPGDARQPDNPAPSTPDTVIPPITTDRTDAGYSLEEIRDASQGVFGKLSSELAGVITYAFRKFGQPNGYIIGDEGGGAFLAGLRYGEGQLRTRIGGDERGPVKVFWQGPSVGVDFGATGSRTLFLVYNLDDEGRLYERFPGIDGSAYVAGGVGLTVFKSGKTLIVPIRTGLGLRLGASLAYLKFTNRASWNPF